jgi:hypothetical protein
MMLNTVMAPNADIRPFRTATMSIMWCQAIFTTRTGAIATIMARLISQLAVDLPRAYSVDWSKG